MASPLSRDILGRFVCNTMEEALASTDAATHPGARPFDIIIAGGGSFGGVFAQHLLTTDLAHRHRILVLEGGPMTVGEHVQNLPMIGLDVPAATSIARLRAQGNADLPRNEVWGLAWHSSVPFPGLAYCVGGRSLYWGGWAPQPLPAELAGWPAAAVTDLTGGGYQEAARQMGTDTTNDFIYGPLQNALRTMLFDAAQVGALSNIVPLAQLPNHPSVTAGATKDALAEMLGLPAAAAAALTIGQLRALLKLEAPLAVQARTRPGFFPANKFSTGPLLISAARVAWAESNNDDTLKRLMILPNCHVRQLMHDGTRVTTVRTNQGDLPVPAGGAVVLALGTIESTRLALNSFDGLPGTPSVGRGLMGHLRSNLTVRVPRTALPVAPDFVELAAAALLLKGQHTATDGRTRFFHLQITATGLGPRGNNSEAELWKKIPDIDTYDRFATASDTHVVLTLRGIGEMDPDVATNGVSRDAEPDEFGDRRAFVDLRTTPAMGELWDAMDATAEDAALAFTGGGPYEVLTATGWKPLAAGARASTVLPPAGRRDGLGTTHHEAGTLRMGAGPATSATDADAKMHAVANCYVTGPALFPRVGSPNPMLTGTALARRLAEHLTDAAPYLAPDGFTVLFDGVDRSRWRLAGRGDFAIVDGALVSLPGDGLGMAWCDIPTPADFVLRLQFALSRPDDNTGVCVRFPDPATKGYDNTAWVAVNFGLEGQIDDLGRDDGADIHHTGAIYGFPDPGFVRQSCRPLGEWNDYEISCVGQTYTVTLNGVRTTTVVNTDPGRGLPTTAATPSFIGLQAHTGRVAFRHVRLRVA